MHQLKFVLHIFLVSLQVWSDKLMKASTAGRDGLLEHIMRRLPEPFFSFSIGLVFGKINKIEASIYHSFKLTGMLHLLSASGFNVNLVVDGSVRLLSRFFKKSTVLNLAIVVTWFYVASTDCSASIIRAGLSKTLNLLAQSQFRVMQPFRVLIFTIALMLMLDTGYLTNLSFQLSVAASLGLIVVLPKLTCFFSRLKTLFKQDQLRAKQSKLVWLKQLQEAFLTTLSVQLCTLPIIGFYFHELNLFALFVGPFLLLMSNTVVDFVLFFITLVALDSFCLGNLDWLVQGMALAVIWLEQVFFLCNAWLAEWAHFFIFNLA